jgi:hypothetical protein
MESSSAASPEYIGAFPGLISSLKVLKYGNKAKEIGKTRILFEKCFMIGSPIGVVESAWQTPRKGMINGDKKSEISDIGRDLGAGGYGPGEKDTPGCN